MQIEMLHRKKWKTRVELVIAIFDFIEIFRDREMKAFPARPPHRDRVRANVRKPTHPRLNSRPQRVMETWGKSQSQSARRPACGQREAVAEAR